MNRSHLSLLFPFLSAGAFAQFNATITVTDLGTGAPMENATVELDGNSQATDALGQTVFTGLVDNIYEYSVSALCYNTGFGSIIIAGGDGEASLAMEAMSSNNVFFFIGSPLAITGATVNLTDGADFNMEFITSDPFGGKMVGNVPFGAYSYTITIPCYEPISGTVTVDCNNGDGIIVSAEPVELTVNNVFFFIGSPFALLGATVDLTDGADYNHSFVTWDTWGGEMVADVPYGEYTYTISKPCYETVTGTVTVECNNGEGIAVFAEPVEIVLDLTVNLDGNLLTAAATGLAYQWVDCDNSNEPILGAVGQSFEPTVNGNYAVIITSGNCSQTSSCTAVTTLGTEDLEGRDGFTLFPNPFSDMLTVRTGLQSGTVRAELFSADGRLVLEGTRSGLELITLGTAALPSGTYVLRLTTANARATRSVVLARP